MDMSLSAIQARNSARGWNRILSWRMKMVTAGYAVYLDIARLNSHIKVIIVFIRIEFGLRVTKKFCYGLLQECHLSIKKVKQSALTEGIPDAFDRSVLLLDKVRLHPGLRFSFDITRKYDQFKSSYQVGITGGFDIILYLLSKFEI